jgi:hypothetical protein
MRLGDILVVAINIKKNIDYVFPVFRKVLQPAYFWMITQPLNPYFTKALDDHMKDTRFLVPPSVTCALTPALGILATPSSGAQAKFYACWARTLKIHTIHTSEYVVKCM